MVACDIVTAADGADVDVVLVPWSGHWQWRWFDRLLAMGQWLGRLVKSRRVQLIPRTQQMASNFATAGQEGAAGRTPELLYRHVAGWLCRGVCGVNACVLPNTQYGASLRLVYDA